MRRKLKNLASWKNRWPKFRNKLDSWLRKAKLKKGNSRKGMKLLLKLSSVVVTCRKSLRVWLDQLWCHQLREKLLQPKAIRTMILIQMTLKIKLFWQKMSLRKWNKSTKSSSIRKKKMTFFINRKFPISWLKSKPKRKNLLSLKQRLLSILKNRGDWTLNLQAWRERASICLILLLKTHKRNSNNSSYQVWKAIYAHQETLTLTVQEIGHLTHLRMTLSHPEHL